MDKSKLVTGDLIVFNGKMHKDAESRIVRVYRDTERGDIVSGDTWFPLKDRKDENLFGDVQNHFEFVWFEEVWRPKSNMAFKYQKPSHDTHDLIWKRVHKTAAEKELEQLMVRVAELEKTIAEEKGE
ncbi:MAG: hypothetical protein [Caudoviricetes sp.]|nr:MAG: hypothetical protein [Caudoviricetes sp.]